MKNYKSTYRLGIMIVASAIAAQTLLLLSCSDDATEVNFTDPADRYATSAITESEAIEALRRQFFEQTGSYVVFNDTLQRQFLGTDRNGDDQWFIETVDLTYSVGTEASGVTKYRFTLLQSDEEKMAALEYLKDYILPHLTGKIRPFAWLLTNTITHNDNFGTYNDYAATGQEVAAVACKLPLTLSKANKQRYTAQVMNILLGKLILNNSSAFEAFFAICENLYATQFADPETITTAENNIRLYTAGFITRGKDPMSMGVSNGFYPDRETDLTSFCRTVVANTEEQLEARYGQYPLVMQKFRIARETMQAIGYVF